MNYNNESVRRQDRLLQEAEAMNLLKSGEYDFLSMVSEEGSGYGIPLSYVIEEDKIYFHCAQVIRLDIISISGKYKSIPMRNASKKSKKE